MELILWRHADAEIVAPSDLARPLTAKGQRQAQAMAAWLAPRLAGQECRLIASGARRAQQTLAELGQPFQIDPRLDPGMPPRQYLAVAGAPAAATTVLLVGHQPAIGRLASLLLSGVEQDWSVKKGALWWLQYRPRADTAGWVLRAMQIPDLL